MNYTHITASSFSSSSSSSSFSTNQYDSLALAPGHGSGLGLASGPGLGEGSRSVEGQWLMTLLDQLGVKPVPPTPTSHNHHHDNHHQHHHRSFLSVLGLTLATPPRTAWSSFEQYTHHIETTLKTSIQRFVTANLIHYAEIASFRLLSLYREQGHLDKMMVEHQRSALAFQAMSEFASSNLSVGTFYAVFFLGLGVPTHLRRYIFFLLSPDKRHPLITSPNPPTPSFPTPSFLTPLIPSHPLSPPFV